MKHATLPMKALAGALILSLGAWSALASAADRYERSNRYRQEITNGSSTEKVYTPPVTTETLVTTQDASTLVQTQILSLINQARAASRVCGTTTYPAVGPLVLNAKLVLASNQHAVDIANKNYFSHTGLDGSTPWDRMTRVGYIWRTAGENISAGQTTPAAVVDGWLKSAGHCKNIMNAGFKDLGVGYGYNANSRYRSYWVTMFGSQRS